MYPLRVVDAYDGGMRIKKESVEDLFASDRRLGSLEEQDPDSALIVMAKLR